MQLKQKQNKIKKQAKIMSHAKRTTTTTTKLLL